MQNKKVNQDFAYFLVQNKRKKKQPQNRKESEYVKFLHLSGVFSWLTWIHVYSWIEQRNTWFTCTLAPVSPAARTLFPPDLLPPPDTRCHLVMLQLLASTMRLRNGDGTLCQRHWASIGQQIFLLIALYYLAGVWNRNLPVPVLLSALCYEEAAQYCSSLSLKEAPLACCLMQPATAAQQWSLKGHRLLGAPRHWLFCVPVASSSSLTLQQPRLITIFL